MRNKKRSEVALLTKYRTHTDTYTTQQEKKPYIEYYIYNIIQLHLLLSFRFVLVSCFSRLRFLFLLFYFSLLFLLSLFLSQTLCERWYPIKWKRKGKEISQCRYVFASSDVNVCVPRHHLLSNTFSLSLSLSAELLLHTGGWPIVLFYTLPRSSVSMCVQVQVCSSLYIRFYVYHFPSSDSAGNPNFVPLYYIVAIHLFQIFI